MIRCKCGKYTDYGLTCSSCRAAFSTDKKYVEDDENYNHKDLYDDKEPELDFESLEVLFEADED